MPFSDMKAHEFFQLKISPFQAWLRIILAGDASPCHTHGLSNEVQTLLLCPGARVDNSSPQASEAS